VPETTSTVYRSAKTYDSDRQERWEIISTISNVVDRHSITIRLTPCAHYAKQRQYCDGPRKLSAHKTLPCRLVLEAGDKHVRFHPGVEFVTAHTEDSGDRQC